MLSKSETDSVVGNIEVSVELVDEGVTKDESILEGWREIHSLNSEHTLSLILNGNLEDVVDGSKSVLVAWENEGEVGIFIKIITDNVLRAEVRESQEHSLNNLLGSNEYGSTSVDDSISNLVSFTAKDNWVDVDDPPSLKDNRVVLERGSSELRINTTENERRTLLTSLIGKEESEWTILDWTLVHEHLEDRGNSIDRDSSESHAEDTIELRSQEGNTLESSSLTESNALSRHT